jgi:hypothetical protein
MPLLQAGHLSPGLGGGMSQGLLFYCHQYLSESLFFA